MEQAVARVPTGGGGRGDVALRGRLEVALEGLVIEIEDPARVKRLAEVFRALGHPVRLGILSELRECGELSPVEYARGREAGAARGLSRPLP
jgi:hypothetical protein